MTSGSPGVALTLLLAYAIVLSVTTYLVASNAELNFLEQRESVSLTLQVAVAIGALLALLAAADAISGERERGTLETLLLSPAPRRSLVIGKAVAALTLWVAAFIVSVPYVWYLARGVGVVKVSLLNGFLVGSLLSLSMVGLGLLISMFAESNRVSLSVSFITLLALFAPTQMPSTAQRGWFGDLLLRADPFTAGLRYLGRTIINARTFGQEGHWLDRSGHRRGGRARCSCWRSPVGCGSAPGGEDEEIPGDHWQRPSRSWSPAPVAAWASHPPAAEPLPVSVELDQDQAGIAIGQTLRFTSTVRNPGEQEVSGAIAHLNVLAVDPGVYVDPEDWSGERTQYLDPLGGGESDPLEWEMQAVNSGRFLVYVVITSDQAAGAVVASKTLRLDVAAQRTVDAGGVLPIAVGVPGAIVLLMGLITIRNRRRP